MFCSKCGQENTDDSVYCKKCGRMIEVEEETRVAAKLQNADLGSGIASSIWPSHSDTIVSKRGDQEEELRIFSITRTLKFVYAGYVATVLSAFLLVALLTIFVSGFAPWIGVVVGILLLLIPAYFHVRQKLVRYSLNDATLEIDRGLIARTTQNVPLRRIQDVTVSTTLLQRLLGYGDVTIDNASEEGGKVVLDNVDSPKRVADLILRQMRAVDK